MSDWQAIRERLDTMRRDEQIDLAWREHRAQDEWTPLSDLGKPRRIIPDNRPSGEISQ